MNIFDGKSPLTHFSELGVFCVPKLQLKSSREELVVKKYKEKYEQMELLGVREEKPKRIPAKRVDVVRLKMVKESSILYKNRVIRSPEDSYRLFKEFLGNVDREYFVVICLDTKNQPTAINVCHIGSLNASLVHPREVMKPAILSNAASILVGHNHPSGNALTIV